MTAGSLYTIDLMFVIRTARSNMMRRTVSAFALIAFTVVLLAMPESALAQQLAANAAPANTPQLKISPLKALQNFEPAADEEYEIGAGDEINIDVPGYPELTGKRTVGPDGKITLPATGSTTTNPVIA